MNKTAAKKLRKKAAANTSQQGKMTPDDFVKEYKRLKSIFKNTPKV